MPQETRRFEFPTLKARSTRALRWQSPGRWTGLSALNPSGSQDLGRCPRLVWSRAVGANQIPEGERESASDARRTSPRLHSKCRFHFMHLVPLVPFCGDDWGSAACFHFSVLQSDRGEHMISSYQFKKSPSRSSATKKPVGLPRVGIRLIRPAASRPKERIWPTWKRICARRSNVISKGSNDRDTFACGFSTTPSWPPRETSTGRFRP